MQIRAITAFMPGSYPVDEGAVTGAAAFLRAARTAYERHGYTVQTVRLATTPFPAYLPDPAALPELAARLAALAKAGAIDYVALGPVRLGDDPAYIDALAGPLAAGQAFASVEIADCHGHLSLGASRRAAALIRAVAEQSGDGFGNLYLAALANCAPETPFFPASYAAGPEPHFALAVECADLAVAACRDARTPAQAAARLHEAIERAGAQLADVAQGLEAALAVRFVGLDFSLAPYPEEARSLGTALALLGAPAGAEGGVLAAALLADAVQGARFPRAGFSGLMLPVLEDAGLAARAGEGALRVHDLLLMSAVCGTGLDTIPLPGDASVDALAGVLADVGALALRSGKPLTARLMPLPGKQAGDPVTFDFPYFANSRVMALGDGLSQGPLATEETVTLARYQRG
ncbi:MAG TPA: DUF711 family protein [Anaerolineae bacterium]|nr:DUF711 family protein [Anaerolineae bacterium]HOG46035.1 DUF711 family protein [Anaerolineae bacterium]HOR00120.1 DUF711 family protein [Anaerolineae bacterium]